MADDSGSRSRRAYLRRLSAVVGGGALAGCSLRDGGGGSTRTPREPTCADGDVTDAPPLYDWMPYLRPGEYGADSLTVTGARPIAIAQFPALRSLLEPYLLYLTQDLNRIGLEFGSVDRMLYARQPGQEHSAYFVVEDPGTTADRRAWLGRLRLQTFVTELEDYRSYGRRAVKYDQVRQIGFDNDVVVVAPSKIGAVSLGAPARLRRVVDTARGDERPLYCYDPDVRALVERLPRSDMTYAKLRTDDGSFGSGDPMAPPGSRAAALTLYLRWGRRDLFVGDGRAGPGTTRTGPTDVPAAGTRTGSTDPTSTATGSGPTQTPTRNEASTPTPTESGPDEPLVDLALVAAFPDDADTEAVRAHVDDRWTGPTGDPGIAFDDPDVRTEDAVVTVSETRPLGRIVE